MEKKYRAPTKMPGRSSQPMVTHIILCDLALPFHFLWFSLSDLSCFLGIGALTSLVDISRRQIEGNPWDPHSEPDTELDPKMPIRVGG